MGEFMVMRIRGGRTVIFGMFLATATLSVAACGGSGTAKSASIQIENVDDCSGGQSAYGTTDSDGSYWGACFKAVGVDPNTSLTCTIVARDSSGATIDTNTVDAVVTNDGSVMAIGSGMLGQANSTPAIANAVARVIPTCSTK